MLGRFDKLTLACLTPEQRDRTCSYWYVVQSNGLPHTAFRTRAALEDWLEVLGIELTQPLPDELGAHQYQHLRGDYSVRAYGSGVENLPQGARVLWLSNGDYTTATITRNGGPAVVRHVSVNHPRPKWPHWWARGRVDAGNMRLPSNALAPSFELEE